MDLKPFVHIFRTPGEYYCYDVNRSTLIKINEDLFEDIKNEKYGENEHYKKLLNSGYLCPKDDSEITIEHPVSSYVEEYLESNVQQLILQVTQNCNLRCKYCVYSGSYRNRTHTNKRMSFQMAVRAIDFFADHSKMTSVANISFYGGEPLLEFQLIKDLVEYCDKKLAGKEIKYNITTNATLLTSEIAKFLSDNNFALNISLDGPKSVQDNSRVFADGDRGTFDTVIRNVEMIEKEYPQYIESVSFNAVIDKRNDFTCSSNFFTYEFLKNAVVTSTGVSDRDSNDDVTLQDAFYINYNYELFKSFLSCVGLLDKNHVSKLVRQYVWLLKTNIHDRITGNYHRRGYCHPNGPCLAGANRLFVTVDGEFYPCERVSETNDAYNIGNLVDGFSSDKVRTLLNTGKMNEDECKNCWAINLCGTCAADFGDENGLSPQKKHEKCKYARLEVEARLKEYCILREYGYYFDE